MKKIVLIVAALFTIGTATTQVVLKNKQYKNKSKDRFSVKENVVYYDGKALAKYLEEYNLLMVDNKVDNKQIIGDLIDFVSDRHKGAEVEVEIDANGSDFKL